MEKIIITVVGKDKVGIMAKVCTFLADNDVNIMDISQTIVEGYFNMMMVVDVQQARQEFAVLSDEIEEVGRDIGCIIKMQREEIFDKMHRI